MDLPSEFIIAGGIKMSSKKVKYSQEYKQTIVNLYHSGKTYSEIHRKYAGISRIFNAVSGKRLSKRRAHIL